LWLTATPPKRASNKIISAVRLLNGEKISAKSFILATGGKSHPETGSTGDGFGWLAKLGHTITPPMAALVPIIVSDPWVKQLSGVSLKNAKITLLLNGSKVTDKFDLTDLSKTSSISNDIANDNKSKTKLRGIGKGVKRGKVLFTHFGLSGPAILNMSSEVNELLKYGEVIISIDLLPEHDHSTLNEALQKLFTEQSNKKFKNAITTIIPSAFVPVILEKSGIEDDTFCHSVTREERLALIKIFKGLEIHPTGLLGADKAIITSGGVALPEVDFRTMQSRLILNLYLVGDILNIDRPSGGYSLQLCWTTGWVAGNSVSAGK
jgi:predicted flavoprotein YhiN